MRRRAISTHSSRSHLRNSRRTKATLRGARVRRRLHSRAISHCRSPRSCERSDPPVRAGALAHRSGYYTSPEYTPSLSVEQKAFFDDLLARDPAHSNIPVPFADAIARIRASKIDGLSPAFRHARRDRCRSQSTRRALSRRSDRRVARGDRFGAARTQIDYARGISRSRRIVAQVRRPIARVFRCNGRNVT